MFLIAVAMLSVLAFASCGGPKVLRFTGSVKDDGSVAVFPVTVDQAGTLTASVQWTGAGVLRLELYDGNPLAQPPQALQLAAVEPTDVQPEVLSVPVSPKTYHLMVAHLIAYSGHGILYGACNCTNTFTLTVMVN